MHRAPAVNFSVKRSRWHGQFILAMGLLALTILVVFAADHAVLDMRVLILATACAVASSIAFIGWKKSPQGRLRWDGQHWYWSGCASGSTCQLSVLIDFQSIVVVSITSEMQMPLTVWLEAASDATSWKALRRALVSNQAASDGKHGKFGPVADGELA